MSMSECMSKLHGAVYLGRASYCHGDGAVFYGYNVLHVLLMIITIQIWRIPMTIIALAAIDS